VAEAELVILDIEHIDDWQNALDSVAMRDVYFVPLYLQMVSKNGDGIPKLAWLRCSHGNVIYPFLVRPISINGKDTGCYDITSPYGYGGPILRGTNRHNGESLAAEFIQQFHDYCTEKNIVTEFIRFHPLLRNANVFSGLVPVEHIRNTVYVDLQGSLEGIWNDTVSGKTRNAIRKAKKSGVSVRYSRADGISRFVNLYHGTMKRLEADTYYYFTEPYFDHLGQLIDESGTLIEAVHKSEVIASIVVLVGDVFSHYHLSASDTEFRKLQANSLLLWEAIKWSKEQGLSLMHLGGGYSASEDSLFKFKAGFSPCTAEYHVGKVIHDTNKYAELVTEVLGDKRREAFDNINFFPAYRLGLEKDGTMNV
jgi:lipid II:glycine glycyltransferase (peptidoglycan interpeptide bridge formation enzyme)